MTSDESRFWIWCASYSGEPHERFGPPGVGTWRPITASKFAALDACGRPVEPPPQAPGASPAAAAQSALRRADPGRRFAPRLARRTRPERLSDELRRRCNRCGAGPFLKRGNNLGGGRSAGSLGAPIRRSQGAVLRLEERLQAPADSAGSDRGHRRRSSGACAPSWASVRQRRRKPRAEWSGITAPIKTA